MPAGATVRLSRVLLISLVLLACFIGRYWYAAAPEGRPALGASFSCRQVEYLAGDCQSAFAALLDDVGVRHVRLSLYWDQVEPQPGQYDFSVIDALVGAAASRGADVLMTVGIKAQRYPEVYLPGWVADTGRLPEGTALDRVPGVRKAALAYIDAAVRHFSGASNVIGWQVENEPFIKNFDKIRGWVISLEMINAEIAAVRAADAGRHRIVVTHSSWTIYDQAWKQALGAADILGQNVFTKKAWITDWWYFFPFEMGPFVPDLPSQAAAARIHGKELWITELQAEPEERSSLNAVELGSAKSMSPRVLESNVRLARRSGASRVYLWGAEWWYATRGRDPKLDMWQAAKRLFAETR